MNDLKSDLILFLSLATLFLWLAYNWVFSWVDLLARNLAFILIMLLLWGTAEAALLYKDSVKLSQLRERKRDEESRS